MTARACCCRRVVFLAGIFLACAVRAAGLVICAKCGTEAAGSAPACAHCGASLPVVAAAPDAASPAVAAADTRPATVTDLALEAARTDKRVADENLSRRPELAYAYYENALALGRLVRREGMPADAGKSLAGNLERCRSVLALSPRPCTACSGSGKRTVQFQSLGGDKSARAAVQVADGPACAVCGGRGTVAAGRSADELRVLIAQGRRDFETRQQALGRVASGRVWVPQDLLAMLDVKSQALLRTACPAPCSGCMGIGIQDCVRCKGAARLTCTGNGCVDGWVVRKDANALSAKTAISRRERCLTCQGSGFMPCADCRGSGTISCKNCSGTGRNAICQECGGQGWGACTKCQGSGSAGSATCPECRGKTERLCPKCRGEGCALR
ncbi:MAG: hypothetical protein WCI17_09970 [bacterium]